MLSRLLHSHAHPVTQFMDVTGRLIPWKILYLLE